MSSADGIWTRASSSGRQRISGPGPNTRRKGGFTVVIIADGQPAVFVAPRERTQRATLRQGDVRLEPGEVRRIARAGQRLRVVAGGAWVTFAGQDAIVLAGQTIALEPGTDAAVVSALGDEPLVYRVIGTENSE